MDGVRARQMRKPEWKEPVSPETEKAEYTESSDSALHLRSGSEHRAGRAGRVAICAVLASLALIFSYIEMLFPFNFGIPGIKLGLSNLIVLAALYALGPGYALTVNLVRIFLSGLLFGGVSAMLYSLAGGMLSFLVMWILYRTGIFSPVGVSFAGGVAHNLGQLTIAALVAETPKIYLYLPVLMVSGMITGTLLGILCAMILHRLQSVVRNGRT